MRRLYSTFAGGWPGTGLLLIRLVVGSVLAVRAISNLWVAPPLSATFTAIILLTAGSLLIAGLWTPIAGIAIAMTEIWKLLMQPGDALALLLVGSVGAGLAMLGPGRWSVDARLYGWKRLEATPRKKF